MSVFITTARLLIRNFIDEDYTDLVEILTDKAASRYAAYDYCWPTSESAVKALVEWFAKGDQFLAVGLSDTHQVIGYIALSGEKADERDLGYTLHSGFWDRGYASEACRAIIDYAFNVLNLQRISSGTANINYPSVNLLVSLGFTKTGEHIASFVNNPDGSPLEFKGSSYLLEKERWLINGKTGH